MGSTVVRDQDEDRLPAEGGGVRRTGTPGRGVQDGPLTTWSCRSRAFMTYYYVCILVYQFLFHALIKPSSSSFAIEPAVRLLVARLHVSAWAMSFPAG